MNLIKELQNRMEALEDRIYKLESLMKTVP